MVAVTTTSVTQTGPNSGIKRVVIRTDSNCDTAFTLNASLVAYGGFGKLFHVYCNDDTGAVKPITYSALAVTLGTWSTAPGVYTIILEGL